MIITADFERALAAVQAGHSVFITGRAGTGKSTLLRHIRSLFNTKSLAVVAPTGVAALNVDGRTIHDLFAFRMDLTSDLRKYKPPKRLSTVDMLVIDEVSMVKAPLMDMISSALCRAKKIEDPFGGTQSLFIGDLYQLPPVQEHLADDPEMEGYATPFFFSSKAFRQLNVSTIELTTVFRQKDLSFVSLLNAIRDGTFTDGDLEKINSRVDINFDSSNDVQDNDEQMTVTLASTNDYVNNYNLKKLEALSGKVFRFPAVQWGVADANKGGKFGELKNLQLKIGVQVMLQVNQHNYVNGTMGTVIAISSDVITVHVPDLNEEVEVQRYKWETYETRREGKKIVKEVVGAFTQFPLKLAWAVTVHKSQGKTFKRMVYDCGKTFEKGMAYVALSRCTSLEGITLTQPVLRKHIKVHPSVIRFHKKATTTRQRLEDLPVAYVGTVATGADRYRKLVEVAVIRYEQGKEVLRLSTLIHPERDASKAVLAGINATELSLAPHVDEAQPLIALALNGAVMIGCDTEELLEKIQFPAGGVAEGVGIDVGVPQAEGTAAVTGALAMAEKVAKHFGSLSETKRRQYLVAPFESKGWETVVSPYIFSRDTISSVKTFYEKAVAGLEQQWIKDLVLGYAVGVISRPEVHISVCVADVDHLIDPEKAAVLGNRLVSRAKEDKIVSPFEKNFLDRVQMAFKCTIDTVGVGDFREKVLLKPGMRVYVSGGPGRSGSSLEGMEKQKIKNMCSHAKLVFIPQFQKKTNVQVLAVADLSNVGGGSFLKARRWEIPAISWEELVEWANSLKRR